MIYPFFNDIGKMKVSQALPLLELISADYNLELAVLPNLNMKKQPLVLWRNNAMKTAERILRNCQRNN